MYGTVHENSKRKLLIANFPYTRGFRDGGAVHIHFFEHALETGRDFPRLGVTRRTQYPDSTGSPQADSTGSPQADSTDSPAAEERRLGPSTRTDIF
jgi:hypothetical protein